MIKWAVFLSMITVLSVNAMDEILVSDPVQGFVRVHFNPQEEVGGSDYLPLQAQNPKYVNLFHLAYGFLDFCKDSVENHQSSEFSHEKNTPIVQGNLESAYLLITKIRALDQGLISLDRILEELLWMRLELLQNRGECIQKTSEHFRQFGTPGPNYFIPTDPKKLRLLKGGDPQSAYEAIQRYQFVNLMIYNLYKLVKDPTKLSLKIKEYISCSRTLWPLLLDKTTDLSFPDFAVVTQNEDPEELKGRKDYDYFFSNFDPQLYTATMMNWCRQECNIFLSRLEINEWKKSEGGKLKYSDTQPLPKPVWLYPELAKQVLVEKAPQTPSSEYGFINDFVERENARAEARRREQLKRVAAKQIKNQRKEQDARASRFLSQVSDGSVDASNESKEEVLSMDADIIVESSGLQADPGDAVSGFMEVEQADLELESPVSDSKSEAESESMVLEEPKALKKLPPRGMRVFHPESEASGDQDTLLTPAKGKHARVIETIFDYRCHGKGFTFGDFRALWEHLCGSGTVRSSGSGGSHYALLNSTGQVVSGTFAHGDGHTYTKSTVRYLRAALNAIGVYPKQYQ